MSEKLLTLLTKEKSMRLQSLTALNRYVLSIATDFDFKVQTVVCNNTVELINDNLKITFKFNRKPNWTRNISCSWELTNADGTIETGSYSGVFCYSHTVYMLTERLALKSGFIPTPNQAA